MRAGAFWTTALITMLVAGTARAEGKNPMVLMSTSMGDIKIELYEDKAPVTVKNFLDYVNDKFYDGTIFHRVIPSFMIQGGGFDNRHEAEAHRGADQERGGERTDERHAARSPWRAPAIRTARRPSSSSTWSTMTASTRPEAGRLWLRGLRQSGQGHGRGGQDRARANDDQGHEPRRAGGTRGDQIDQLGEVKKSPESWVLNYYLRKSLRGAQISWSSFPQSSSGNPWLSVNPAAPPGCPLKDCGHDGMQIWSLGCGHGPALSPK